MSIHVCSAIREGWLFKSEPDQVSVSQVVAILDPLGKPAVLSPSAEAAVHSEDEGPSVKDEADEFELHPLPPVGNMEDEHWDVDDPDEDIGARLAESEEYEVECVVDDEIDQDKHNSNEPPR